MAFPAVIEHADAGGQILVVCEHAANDIPAHWGDLGLTGAQRQQHIAWDPGALALARALAGRLEATLVHAPVSRLVYDLNRAPHQPGAMPLRSEMHEIPGNAGLSPAERLARTRAVYLPFHVAVRGIVVERLALGRVPALVTVHSFTPTWFGTPRAVEIGVIHDADPALATAIVRGLAAAAPGRDIRLNQPYSAADDVTHTLRLQATPFGLHNAMLEIRNDLIADPAAVGAMADLLAPVIADALAALPPTALSPPPLPPTAEETAP